MTYAGARAAALSVAADVDLALRMLTLFGVVVLTFMMVMYALERKGSALVLAFALGCGLSSVYGFLSGAWPFGVVEAAWMLIAIRRYAAGPTPRRSPD